MLARSPKAHGEVLSALFLKRKQTCAVWFWWAIVERTALVPLFVERHRDRFSGRISAEGCGFAGGSVPWR